MRVRATESAVNRDACDDKPRTARTGEDVAAGELVV